MAVYMIAYELHEGEDYEGDLIKAIKALPSGGSWHKSWIDLVRHQHGSCGPNPQFIETACIRWG